MRKSVVILFFIIMLAGAIYLQLPERVKESVLHIAEQTEEKSDEKFIKWAEFNVSYEALNYAYQYDVDTFQSETHIDWIQLLAYLGAKYGGDFKLYKQSDMSDAAEALKKGDLTMEELTKKMENYDYYYEVYDAVLGGMVGTYQIQEEESGKKVWKKKYGLKSFHPIAKGFPYGDYDDFGVSRSYGYQRNHLGHDMMGQVGTPVVAVESGYVYSIGWNQYGGWRIGISSFDNQRYYYYAHLRQDFPFAKWIKEGSIINAGDVIGYMGRTGYSANENVNNIDTYHLHFGMQLIFDESQREGNNEIWIDVYPLVRFLYQNQSETVRDNATKEWARIYKIKDPKVGEYKRKDK